MVIEAEELLGREQELAAVDRFLAAIEEQPAALVLEGEPGIGKTALVGHAVDAARRRGYRILATRPTSAESSLSFVGLTDLLLDVRDRFDELPSPQRRALEAALLLDDSAETPPDPRAIGMGLLGVLRALASSSPVVVAVDDLQWLDAPSAAALSFALRRGTEEPIGLLVAMRKDSDSSAAADLIQSMRAERLALGPLSVGAIHALLVERLQLSIPRSLLLRIHEACRGNPLFALEIGRALIERGLPEPGQPFRIPTDRETLFAARLEQLPAETLDALAVAAATAAPTRSLVSTASPGALEPAVRAEIIRLEGKRIRFTHPLLASAVYMRLDSATRRELHRRIAAVTDKEERARHLALAAGEPDSDVAAALDEAAEEAGGRGAHTAAAELAELAVKLTPPEDTECLRVRRRIAAQLLELAGDAPGARNILEHLIPELLPGTERARALLQLADIETALTTKLSLRRQAVGEAAEDDALLAKAHRDVAVSLTLTGEPEEALAQLREAVAAAERAGDVRLLVASMATLAGVEIWRGHTTPDLLTKALALEQQTGYLRVYESPTTIDGLRLMILEDDLDAARMRFLDATRLAQDHGDDEARAVLLGHLAELECRTGNLDDAAHYVSEANELHEQFGLGGVPYALALVELTRGRAEVARATAERAVALAEERGNEAYAVRNLRILGLLALSTGDPSTAVRILAPLPDRVSRQGYWGLTLLEVLPDAIEALVGAGDRDRATAQLEQLDDLARTLGNTYARARAARCRALLAADNHDYDTAFRAFDEALEVHEQLPDPLERGRTLLALGKTQRRAGHRRDARARLQNALATFEEFGATLWAEQTRAVLGRLGGRTHSERTLTEAEERVASLVAEGKSNREAAAALFVTERTVRFHLTSIYRKLELRSRSQLARHFARGNAREIS